MPDANIDDQKTALRNSARAARAKAHARQADRAGAAVAATGLGFIGLADDTIVSAYAALPHELDTSPLLSALHARGVALALPITIGPAQALQFRSWQPGDSMRVGLHGIVEPAMGDAAIVQPDIVLLPLLAFDRQGYRLGYGGGYYDRTLAQLRKRKPIIAIGIAYDEQEVTQIPHDRHDQRLDWILTPSGARGVTADGG